eukprot:gene747-335_t
MVDIGKLMAVYSFSQAALGIQLGAEDLTNGGDAVNIVDSSNANQGDDIGDLLLGAEAVLEGGSDRVVDSSNSSIAKSENVPGDPSLNTEVVVENANKEDQAVVTAKTGFPESRKLGFCTMPEDLKLTELKVGGWALENTNLIDYIGWFFIRINSHPVADQEEFNHAKAALSPGDSMTFTLQKSKAIDIDDSSNANQRDDTDDLPLGAEAVPEGGNDGAEDDLDEVASMSGEDDFIDEQQRGEEVSVGNGADLEEHNYFDETVLSTVSGKNEIDDGVMSDTSSCPPVVLPLPSGKRWDVQSNLSSLMTRATQVDAGSSSISMPDGMNDFFLACAMGDASVVRRLLERGDIDVNKATEGDVKRDSTVSRCQGHRAEGMTPLMIASNKGHSSVVQRLLACSQIEINKVSGGDGRTALNYSCQEGHVQVVKLLLAHPEIDVNRANKLGYTALIEAATEGHPQIVQDLLARPEIDVNRATEDGHTSLIWAAMRGHTQVAQDLLARPEIDVNRADEDGYTALILAAMMSRTQVAQDLLAHPEIDVNRADKDGSTALFWAADEDIAQMIRNHPNFQE